MEIGNGGPAEAGDCRLHRAVGYGACDFSPCLAFLLERRVLREPDQIGRLDGAGLVPDAAQMPPDIPGVDKVQDAHSYSFD